MAITLNLKHTFTTRIVYSSELIAEIREELRIGLSTNNIQDGRIGFARKCLEGTDEELVLAISKSGFRDNIRQELASLMKDLNVTRMGPIQTEVVTGCKGCVYIAEGCAAASKNERCNDFAKKWAE